MLKPLNLTVDGKILVSLASKGKKADLKIIGGIDWWKNSSDEFTRKVDDLLESGVTDLHLYINTPGGSVFDANETVNQINRFTGELTCEVGALCASAGTILLMPFKTANITAAKNATFMLHNPSMGASGEAKQLRSSADLLDGIKEQLLDDYTERMTLSRNEISANMDNTWWMNAKKAKEVGLIGSVDEKKTGTLPKDTKDVFNRYKYEHIPDVLNSLLNEDIAPSKPKQKTDTNIKMKNLIVLLTALFDNSASAPKLTEESNEQEVINAIKGFVKAKDDKIVELTAELDKFKDQQKEEFKTFMDNAVKEGKLTAELRKKYDEMAEDTGIENVKAVVNGLTPRLKIKDHVKSESGSSDDHADWKWEDFIENGCDKELLNMNDPNHEDYDKERFDKLKNAYYSAK